jgi:TolA-binding protein
VDLDRLLRRAAPALLLAAAGCGVPLERGRILEARIARLEVESREQARVIDEQLRDKLAQVDRKLREVQAKLDELNTTSRAKGADLGVAVGKLQEELVKVRGDLEAQAHQLQQVEEQLASATKETDTRLAALRGTGALDEAMARQKLAELPKPDDKAAVFALAVKEEAAGEKGVARELFLHFVKRWPKDDKAAEAGLRAGQILAWQGRWREALVALGRVVEQHPKSEAAPAALLLVAEGTVQLDRRDDARSLFEQVMSDYPKSEAAGKARARLAELFPAKKPPQPKKK